MRCQQTILCALLGLVAAGCNAEQAIFQKAYAAETAYLAAQKDGFHSHLQRMLLGKPATEVTPGTQICSPAARKSDGGCADSDVEVLSIPKPETSVSSSSSVGAPNCTGPQCLVAPMPGEAATAPGNNKNESSGPRAPQAKPVAYGPMTHDAFERLAQRKRNALKARLEEAGALNAEIDAYLSEAPTVKDDAGIPLPASRTSSMPAEPPKVSATTTLEAAETPAPQPKSVDPRADFEMRFEPQTPSPDPHFKVLEIAESPAPAHPLTAHFSALRASHKEYSETPSLDPHLTVTESPLAAALDVEQQSSSCNPTGSSTSCEASTSGSASSDSDAGPARPPMTEAEAARIASQQAVNAAAREAALARKREQVRSEHAAIQAKKTGKQPEKKQRGGSSQRIRNQSPPAGTPGSRTAQQRPTEFERTLMSKSGKSGAAQAQRFSNKAAGAAVIPPALVAAASPRWEVLDYVCVLSIAAVLLAALFIAVAIVEDMTAARQAARALGTPLPVHWIALSRGLWRRCRRSFLFALKHIAGHASDLPVSTNESAHANVIGQLLGKSVTFVHVFLAHLSHLRSNPSSRSRASSSGGGALDPAAWGVPARATSGISPFAAVAMQQQQPCVIQAEDSSTVSALAELQLRRRH